MFPWVQWGRRAATASVIDLPRHAMVPTRCCSCSLPMDPLANQAAPIQTCGVPILVPVPRADEQRQGARFVCLHRKMPQRGIISRKMLGPEKKGEAGLGGVWLQGWEFSWCQIGCYMGCHMGCSDTNKKINYRLHQ
jgi:hypothetical protein